MTLLIDSIAAYRLTRLATKDVLTQRTRDSLIRSSYKARRPAMFNTNGTINNLLGTPVGDILDSNPEPGAWQQYAEDDPNPPKLATLITCRWCAGMWIAFTVLTLRIVAPRQWNWLARALTAATAAALLARLEDD